MVVVQNAAYSLDSEEGKSRCDIQGDCEDNQATTNALHRKERKSDLLAEQNG